MFDGDTYHDYNSILDDTDPLYYDDYEYDDDDISFDCYYHNIIDELDNQTSSLMDATWWDKCNHFFLLLRQYVRIVPSIFAMNIMNKAIEDFRKTNSGQYIQGASHTCRVLNHKERNKITIKAVCDLRKIKDQFDSIVCCGISGLMVAPQVAELLDKHIIIVRKDHEKCYSEFTIEGVAPSRYIILDDLICSGDTVRYIKSTISNEYSKSICVGLYCYMPQECAYTEKTKKEFEKHFRMLLLNPYQQRVQVLPGGPARRKFLFLNGLRHEIFSQNLLLTCR